MCGISGIVSLSEVSRIEIEQMTDAIKHRGPDAHGYYYSNHVALGHRRLSIVDLDARSNQPFFSGDGRYILTFNGEIYNFHDIASELAQQGVKLRTTSDTEVIVEAFAIWGPGFVHKLNGMFAFAIFDTLEKKLFLFRDRIGKKPLFYYIDNGVFLFASEIKSILRHPLLSDRCDRDYATISSFLQFGFIPEPHTFFKGIRKFPAAHYGVLSSDLNLSLLPYWNIIHNIKSDRKISEPVAIGGFRTLLDDAVRRRLEADVPVGVFLSGGVDSSLVAASAARVTGHLKTFSIGFKESKFNESAYAEKVAKHLKTDHHSYTLLQSEAVELLNDYVDHFDEPFADTSAIPTMLVSQLARKHVKVALTGDGGDELFLGYGAYKWAERLNNPLVRWNAALIRQLLLRSPDQRLKRAASLFENVPADKKMAHIFSQEQYFFSESEIQKQLLIDPQGFLVWTDSGDVQSARLTAAEKQSLFDLRLYLRDDLLVKVDRASMFYGLECRSPLLDYRLVEFAANLPIGLKVRGSSTKFLLRKVLFERIPMEYFRRPKWGFGIPLADWMKNELRHLFNYINEESLAATGIFNARYVKNLILRFERGETFLFNRLWVLIVAQKYLLKK